MSVVLGLDTSTTVCAGVAIDGRVAASAAVDDPRAHAEQLMPLLVRVLASAGVSLGQVDAVAVGVGPGPFTGLRVGVVTAATLAEVRGLPVRGICSLDVVAAQWVASGAPEEFVVVSDARRREVYWARYGGDGVRLDGPHVSAPTAVPELPLGGPGASIVGAPQGPTALDAGVLAARAADLPDAGLEPLYLRRPDATEATHRKSTIPQARLALGRRS